MKTEIIIVHETTKASIIKDTYSVLTLFAMIAPGYFLNINVLQWVGGFLFILLILSKSSQTVKRQTIQEAKQFLDQLES